MTENRSSSKGKPSPAVLRTAGPRGGGVQWVGSLSFVPLAEVLKKIALEEKSGDLQVIFGRTIKTIYFDKGFVVFAASNLKRDRIGHHLIQLGRISRREFALTSELMKIGHRRFGQALVHAGLMSQEELGRQVAVQVNRIILSLFRVNDGIYSFDERPSVIPVELMVSLSIHRILLDGVRRMTDPDLILAGLPPSDTWVRVVKRPPFAIAFSKLKPLEQAVIGAVGQGATLQSVLRTFQKGQLEVLRACYGLYAAGLLEPSSSKGRAARRPLKVQEETRAFRLSDLEERSAETRATDLRQEVLMEFDRLAWVEDAALLKVGLQAGPKQIEKAYDERQREWSRKRSLVENERSIVIKVDRIQARLEAAYRRMLTEQHRGLNARAVTDPESQGLAGPSWREASPPPGGKIPEETGFEKAAMESEGGIPDGGARGIELTTSEASPPEGTKELARPETRCSPEPTEPQPIERIEQLLQDIKLQLQVGSREGAISLLFELVELVPNNAAYRGFLAKAMFGHPVMRKNAERHFLEALRLLPQDADLHFWLGLYYKSFGLKSRAEKEFRTVLLLDPEHESARKHLVDVLHLRLH